MVYVFLATGFEEMEALAPVDVLRRAGIETETVGVGAQRVIGAHGIPVFTDTTADRIDAATAEMIVLPGGMPGTLNLQADSHVQAAIDAAVKNNRFVAAICAAPMILGEKGLLDKKKATCYPGFEEKLIGAECRGDAVCMDGKFITGRGPGVAIEFALKLLSVLKGEETAEKIKKTLVTHE